MLRATRQMRQAAISAGWRFPTQLAFTLWRSKPALANDCGIEGADEAEGEGGSLTLLTLLALVVGAISGAVVASSCSCSNRRIDCAMR